jgi:hypothetical protein
LLPLIIFAHCSPCSYISFVEILSTKAVQGFQESGLSEAQSQRYACFSFFAGLMATWLLGKALELATKGAAAWQKRKVGAITPLGEGSRAAATYQAYALGDVACWEGIREWPGLF